MYMLTFPLRNRWKTLNSLDTVRILKVGVVARVGLRVGVGVRMAAASSDPIVSWGRGKAKDGSFAGNRLRLGEMHVSF